MVILMFYPLNEHKMAEIEVELKQRRAEAAAEAPA
jgi:Na+/melibiose symporter-like transporter